MQDDTLVLQAAFRLVVVQDLIECLWVDVTIEAWFCHSEQEVEVVCLHSMLVVALSHNAHHLAKAFYFLDKGHPAS